MKTARATIPAYTTKDGSEIREFLHPGLHAVRSMSFAEAVVAPGESTRLHRHVTIEEIYHVTEGHGRMRLGGEEFDIGPGDSIAIAPGTPHAVTASAAGRLVILCACHPPYSHADTELL